MNAKNPKYSSLKLDTVDMEVQHPEHGWIPFTASAKDVEPHGRKLYERAIAGEFGLVGPYVASITSAAQNKATAERRLAETDWVNQPDVYDPANTPHLTNRDAFIAYRSQIRSVAVSPVEGNLDWPTEPSAVWSQ